MSRVRTVEPIADVRRRPGTQRPILRTFPAQALGPLVTTSSQVQPEADVALDAVAEATGTDVVVSGTVTFAWEGECRRCLQTVTGTTTADLREIFAAAPVEGETWPVVGDTIDLAPMLRETVLLTLPLVPLCAEDCPGPDPERFPAAIEPDEQASGTDDEKAPRDPRWAALDQLRFD